MPYEIRKRGNKWALVRRNGTVKSRHTSKAKAQSSRNVIHAKEHGNWKPTGKPARYKSKRTAKRGARARKGTTGRRK